jgi:hypothetical protein
VALAPVGGASAQPALTPFQRDALRAIYAVLPYQRETFALSVSQESVPVVLYSAAPTPEKLDYERVDCASNAAFKILSQANEAGVIAVSVCPEHVARLRTLATASAQGFDTLLATIQKGLPAIPPDKLRAMGWYRERSGLPGGGEFHYVAIIAVGHGVAVLPTVMLLTDKQAVVVQAESMQLCGVEAGNPFPLCADPKGTLTLIAQRLLR